MLKIAIIGVSGYGKIIYDLCKNSEKTKDVKVIAAVIRTPSKCPDVYEEIIESGGQVFSDAESMFSSMKGQLDLVCIPTGIETHASLSIAAMEAGAHVMVEKPAAGTVEEVDTMMEASKRTGKIVAVGFQDIYRNDIQEIKKKLLTKEWGEVKSVSVLGSWPRPKMYYRRNNWAGRLKSGDSMIFDSPANNALAHYMNLGLYLVGENFKSSASIATIDAESYRAYQIETFDTLICRAKTNSGIQFHYTVTHASAENFEPIVSIKTDKYKIVLACDSNKVYDLDNKLITELEHNDTWTGRNNIIPAVVDKINGHDSFICDLSIARSHTLFINRLHSQNKANDFANDLVYETVIKDNEHLVVKGLLPALKEASSKGALFSEIGYKFN
ncbi:Gfo/Idh/MocA family oxidoreductase [Lentisphaera marina]|uniref:Gfo/Idh/MocA family protein n=1 Tax=Lentisphaera marina TaxID=1111041 RepID=UPI0023658210|nr:Gfo/Idh/MocA family oxidoreductase [Lentisphaera marina]MDD7985325.1 Gfo/Idh/MocA family oxidoreductase [Lentisphaera marina]